MTENSNDVVELAKVDVLQRLDELETMLGKQDPLIPVHLAHIHKALIQYEELVHMLDDQKIGILMQQRAMYQKVELVKEAVSAKRGSKSLKSTTVDDI